MPVSNASLLDLACTTTEIVGWDNYDDVNSVSEAQTDSPGVDPKSTVWSFDTNTGAYAVRGKTVGSIDGLGSRIVISLNVYHENLGLTTDYDSFYIAIDASGWRFGLDFGLDGLFLYNSESVIEIGTNLVDLNTWQEWTFDIDISAGIESAVCDVYLEDILKASNISCLTLGVRIDGDISITQQGYSTSDQITYLDWLKIGDGFAVAEYKNMGLSFFGAL